MGISSSSSTNSDEKKGKNWTCTLYVLQKDDQSSDEVHEIKVEDLGEMLGIRTLNDFDYQWIQWLKKRCTFSKGKQQNRGLEYIYIRHGRKLEEEKVESGMRSEAQANKDKEVIEKCKLFDVEDNIVKVWAYKFALTKVKVAEKICFHMFIVFETQNWWWSIEKNSEDITIQRSRSLQEVRDKFGPYSRPPLTLIEEDRGRTSMKDLIKWLYHEDELTTNYHYLSYNCQHFGKAIFDLVAETKRLKIVFK